MYSFIILHYGNIDDTIECLVYLKKLSNKDTHFIVVDNHTLNKKDEKLIRTFTSDIVLLDKNYGYAKANNRGIEYAKKKYKSKFYVVMNNDVFISQPDFLENIKEDYDKYEFDMLGTYIESPTGESVNPFPVICGKENIEKEIIRCKKLIKIYSNSFYTFLLNNYLKIKHLIKKPIVPTNGKKMKKNIGLHGCCIIFSNKYIKKYTYPFFNETFLFHEEEFLYNRVVKDKLISLYDPTISVFHKEGSSINKTNKKTRLSKLFREKERLKSLELLLKEM